LEKSVLHGREVPVISLEEGEEAVIVSDLHLGLRYKSRFLTKFREFEEFLERLAERGPALLVLLGDALELWSAKASEVFATAYAPFRALAKLDSKVLYVVGNHDRIVAHLNRKGLFEKENLVIAPEYVVLECRGKRGLLFHGHQLDWKFVKLKWLWRLEPYVYLLSEVLYALPWASEWVVALGYVALLPTVMLVTRGAPFPLRLAATLSALLLSAPLIVLFWRAIQDRFWYGLVQPLARSRLRGKSLASPTVSKALSNLLSLIEANGFGKVDFAVFGHTHVPELARDEEGRLIANSGSWVEEPGKHCCTFVRISSGRVVLGRWTGSGEEVLAAESL
jgi:UDP-2,3-diacylglucosamine pyrophosphatase LpxH